jgi:hypothetical protein
MQNRLETLLLGKKAYFVLARSAIPATAHKFVNVVIWFTSNKTSIQEIAEALGREPRSFPVAELAMSGK